MPIQYNIAFNLKSQILQHPYRSTVLLPDKIIITFYFDCAKWDTILKTRAAEHIIRAEMVISVSSSAQPAPLV